jgi:hypothetical protein
VRHSDAIRAFAAGRPPLFPDQGNRLRESYRFPLVSGRFLQRDGQPVGVILALQGGLTPRAKFALVCGVERIAFQLDDPAFPVLGDHPAPRGAFAAGGRIPCRRPGDHVFRRMHQCVERFFRFVAAPGGKGDAAHTSDFQEGSSVHIRIDVYYTEKRGSSNDSRSIGMQAVERILKLFPTYQTGGKKVKREVRAGHRRAAGKRKNGFSI